VSTIIVGSVHLIGTFVAAILVDRLGRRILLMFSSCFIVISLTSLGVFFFIQDSDPEIAKNLGWLPLTSLCVFIIGFALGFGPIPWLVISEVLSNEINDIVAPLCGAFNWSFAFVVLVMFSSITEAISIGPFFWIFAILSAFGPFFIVFILPETKGKTTQEIHRILNGEKKEEKNGL
jgi:MFS family permease